MHSASHRLNHDFQLTHFLANACHTPDGAYALLYSQKIDMESKIACAEARFLKRKATQKRFEKALKESKDEIEILELQSEILELNANAEIQKLNFEGALAELAHIKKLMDELEPQRKYRHLSLLEANEACQREEWELELKRRSENYQIAAMTGIPADQIETMRCHPDFENKILPHMIQFREKVLNKNGSLKDALMSNHKPLLLLKAHD